MTAVFVNDALSFGKMLLAKTKKIEELIADFSKAFDCLCHDLLITKLYSYDLDTSFCNLFQDYFSNRKQEITVDPYFSSWKNLLSGVP